VPRGPGFEATSPERVMMRRSVKVIASRMYLQD
jgi:hypothetical protein